MCSFRPPLTATDPVAIYSKDGGFFMSKHLACEGEYVLHLRGERQPEGVFAEVRFPSR